MSHARDTNLHLPSVHSQDDDTANQITYKPQNITQFAKDSMKMSSSDSKTQPTYNPSRQQQCTCLSDESIQTTSEGISAVSSASSSLSKEPHQVMLRCNDKLIKALSLDPQGIAGILLAKGLIPENTEAQM